MDSAGLVKGDIPFRWPPFETARVVELGQESIDNSAGGLTIHASPFLSLAIDFPRIISTCVPQSLPRQFVTIVVAVYGSFFFLTNTILDAYSEFPGR
jgi:hypothetical protein